MGRGRESSQETKMNIWDEKEINVKPQQWLISCWNAPVPAGNHLMVHFSFEPFPAFCRSVGTPEPYTHCQSFPSSLKSIRIIPMMEGSISVVLSHSKPASAHSYWLNMASGSNVTFYSFIPLFIPCFTPIKNLMWRIRVKMIKWYVCISDLVLFVCPN